MMWPPCSCLPSYNTHKKLNHAEIWPCGFAEMRHRLGFPGGTSGKEPIYQYRRHKRQRFNPWIGKIPWRRAQQPTPVSLPGESHEQRNLEGYSLSGHSHTRLKQLSMHTHIHYIYMHWKKIWRIFIKMLSTSRPLPGPAKLSTYKYIYNFKK